jgi:hypothetical protein
MRLYPETPQKIPLTLADARVLENGVVLQTLRPVAAG